MRTKYDRKTIRPVPSTSVLTDSFTLHDQRLNWPPSLAQDYGLLQTTNCNRTMAGNSTTAHKALSVGISYLLDMSDLCD